mmetsp:Transcript_7569/g.17349  ORF Transcript_7569/g.17349 Transcript_7569/m.17349 type:complete len:235 (+) Transcript_7569:2601-3305(+)
MSKLTMLASTKRVHPTLLCNDSRVESTTRHLSRSFPQEGFHKSRRMTVSFGAMAKSPKFSFAPSIQFALFGQTSRVESTGTQLDNSFSGKPFQQFGSVLMALDITVSGHTILLVSPRVESTRGCNDSRMTTPTCNLRHHQTRQTFHPLGCGMSRFVAVAQLSVHATTPCVQIAIPRHRCRMIRTTSNVHNDLTRKALCDSRNVLPSIVAMSQPSIISAPPCVHFTIYREDNRVT